MIRDIRLANIIPAMGTRSTYPRRLDLESASAKPRKAIGHLHDDATENDMELLETARLEGATARFGAVVALEIDLQEPDDLAALVPVRSEGSEAVKEL
jgi:hypothetical protein